MPLEKNATRGPMQVVEGVTSLEPSHGRLFVVVGVFDGLHLGHLYLIRHLRHEAARRNARPAVITFDAHPDEILVGTAPPLLCDPEERLVRLAAAGVEVTVVQHFDQALRETSYDRFVEMIRKRTDLAGFLMTPDAAFGHNRAGTPEALAALGASLAPPFDVCIVPPLAVEGRPVRSAEIRSDVAAGDFAGARALLGRPFSIVGERVHTGPTVAVPGPARSAADSDAGSDRDAKPPDVAAGDAKPSDVAAGDAMVRLRFALPVALPPPGTYRAAVEPGWHDEAGARSARRHSARAVVTEDGNVDLHSSQPLPVEERLRVTFRDRLPRSLAGAASSPQP